MQVSYFLTIFPILLYFSLFSLFSLSSKRHPKRHPNVIQISSKTSSVFQASSIFLPIFSIFPILLYFPYFLTIFPYFFLFFLYFTLFLPIFLYFFPISSYFSPFSHYFSSYNSKCPVLESRLKILAPYQFLDSLDHFKNFDHVIATPLPLPF